MRKTKIDKRVPLETETNDLQREGGPRETPGPHILPLATPLAYDGG